MGSFSIAQALYNEFHDIFFPFRQESAAFNIGEPEWGRACKSFHNMSELVAGCPYLPTVYNPNALR